MRNSTLLAFVLAASLVACASIPAGRDAVDALVIEGASAVGASSIEEKLATAESPRFLGLWSGVAFDYELFDRFVLERDMARVERFYRARGFYEAHARVVRVVRKGEGHVAITIVVEEGAPVVVARVDIQGLDGLPTPVATAARLAVRRAIIVHAHFDEDDYAAAGSALTRTLTDQGYAWAKVTRAATVDLPGHTANVRYEVAAGPPARVGRVTIEGLADLPEGPVRRALNLTEGNPYSTHSLDSARRALLDLGVFGAVTVAPELAGGPPPSHLVPVRVRVTPSGLRSLRLGGGIEVDVIKTDVHLDAGWQDRNFLGGLRRLTIDVKPGLVLYPTRIPTLQAPENLLPEDPRPDGSPAARLHRGAHHRPPGRRGERLPGAPDAGCGPRQPRARLPRRARSAGRQPQVRAALRRAHLQRAGRVPLHLRRAHRPYTPARLPVVHRSPHAARSPRPAHPPASRDLRWQRLSAGRRAAWSRRLRRADPARGARIPATQPEAHPGRPRLGGLPLPVQLRRRSCRRDSRGRAPSRRDEGGLGA